MTTLTDLTREVIAELDADGGGFRTREATSLLFYRATDGLDLPRHVADLVRLGCGVAISGNKTERAAAQRVAAYGEQSDFADDVPGFDHFLLDFAALDDTADATRKRLLRLTLPELRQVIAMRRRKANEIHAFTDKLQQIVEAHPEWEAHPEAPLADILGIAEPGEV